MCRKGRHWWWPSLESIYLRPACGASQGRAGLRFPDARKDAHLFYWILVLNHLVFSSHVICASDHFFKIIISFSKKQLIPGNL